MNWTFTLDISCMKCQQKITELDITQNNYQLIILPAFTVHHQVCPRPQPSQQPTFTYQSAESLKLKINLK